MTTSQHDLVESNNFWKATAGDQKFWRDYVSTRPNYSTAFYELMYVHHKAHSDSWDVAHDVGCGAGQVSARLSAKFTHIVASDVEEGHLSVAARELEDLVRAERVTFTAARGEDLAAHHPPRSADLIAVAEAMPLMDTEAALDSFARLLRPDGTFSAWFYGRPTFTEPAHTATCQPILDEIMIRLWTRVIENSEPASRPEFEKTAAMMASWLDYIRFDPGTWKDVRRIKWNRSGILPFFGREACGVEIEPVSNVRDGETTEDIDDAGFWKNEWTVVDLRKYFSVLFPNNREFVEDSDDVKKLFDEMEQRMGGEHAVRKFTWPAVLVLATRR